MTTPIGTSANDSLRDWGDEARRGLLVRPIGRDTEIATVYSILSQAGKANVMLLGPPGVGKTALVQGIACDLASGSIPAAARVEELVELNVTALMGGTIYRGQLEQRVTELITYFRNRPTTVVFIDEVHTLLGSGKTMEGGASGDVSQALKPALARGEIRCIAATTDDEYDRYVRADGAFARRFANVPIGPLGEAALLEILARKNQELRFDRGFCFGVDSLRTMIEFSHRFMPDRNQPDKAIDVLERAAASYSEQVGARSAARERVSLPELSGALSRQLALLEAGNLAEAGVLATRCLGVSPKSGVKVEIDLGRLSQLMGRVS